MIARWHRTITRRSLVLTTPSMSLTRWLLLLDVLLRTCLSIWSNGTMPVSTTATATYSAVDTASEPKIPTGMSRAGFTLSSACRADDDARGLGQAGSVEGLLVSERRPAAAAAAAFCSLPACNSTPPAKADYLLLGTAYYDSRSSPPAGWPPALYGGRCMLLLRGVRRCGLHSINFTRMTEGSTTVASPASSSFRSSQRRH